MVIEITSEDIFTPEQLKSHFKIYAGPGAGKTHFLVEMLKILSLTTRPLRIVGLEKSYVLHIQTLRLTKLKRRLDKFTDCVDVCTIHGFIIEHILQPFQQDLISLMESDFGISVESERQDYFSN